LVAGRLPGAAVKADTVLVELSNPEVEQAAFDVEWQLKAAIGESANLRVQLATQKLTQRATVASVQANSSNAKLDLEVNEELAKAQLVPALTLKQSKAKADELAKLREIEEERLTIGEDAAKAQLTVQEAKVEQLKALFELKRRHVEALKVRAGMDGVLQRLGNPRILQVGQQLPAVRVADPLKLKVLTIAISS
jgi:HlyD family secretion protein